MIRCNQNGLLRSFGNKALLPLFKIYRFFSPVRERVHIGEFDDIVEKEHLIRYEFARDYCKGKTVADIACGTGYGTKILKEVATSVHGYDKEPLCENHIIDLETEFWEKEYDVIVSFETIEHIENYNFFLENIWKSAKQLVVSSPVGEFAGYNPYHQQVWTLSEFKKHLEKFFSCKYFQQNGLSILPLNESDKIRFVIAVCSPKKQLSSG